MLDCLDTAVGCLDTAVGCLDTAVDCFDTTIVSMVAYMPPVYSVHIGSSVEPMPLTNEWV
jgi:hypothetical protein